ncbi:twin-arginine translocase TatA/TatE family subunit [Candidatus Tisiphia endosymbiont of Beris chalybata]|uniref:twin-arginine translocase TatA/TatE family subunit n=1 Tax=Candidatus Tisiphia endosymbiont of Beris chalybata TaxID=3066262 RepID=UPI00312C78A8
MGMSLTHLLVILLIVLLLFGAGKLPQVMTELAKGLRAFKEGMKDTEQKPDDKKD